MLTNSIFRMPLQRPSIKKIACLYFILFFKNLKLDPDTKQESLQWKYVNSPPPKKFRPQPSAGKIKAAIFWDCRLQRRSAGGLPATEGNYVWKIPRRSAEEPA